MGVSIVCVWDFFKTLNQLIFDRVILPIWITGRICNTIQKFGVDKNVHIFESSLMLTMAAFICKKYSKTVIL